MMSSMAGLLGSTQAVLEGSGLHLCGSARLASRGGSSGRVGRGTTAGTVVRAQAGEEAAGSRRRAVLGLVATSLAGGSFVQAVLADARSIKLGGPPAPSGGLPGTLNSDEPRDLDLPLSERFYLQPLPPEKAVARAKESANDILKVKGLIDKRAWPFVQNDLRLKGSYLRYDLKTVLASKPRDEKKALKQLTDAVFSSISDLDHAAKIKSTPEAEKYYAASKSAIGDLFAKLG